MASTVQNLEYSHPTQFFIDKLKNEHELNSLSDFMAKEENYDYAMYDAFKYILKNKKKRFKDRRSLTHALDKIHKLATSHLVERKLISPGRVSTHNYFNIGHYHTTDYKGIEDLIDNIWLKGCNLGLRLINEQQSSYVTLTNKKFSIGDSIFGVSYKRNPCDPQTFYKEIKEMISKDYYIKYSEITVHNFDNKKNRSKVLRSLVRKYFLDMSIITIEEKKIEKICLLMRDILQLHLYSDGNGRTVYLLANLIFMQNNIEPFYPKHLCIFDVNSLPKMMHHVLRGQARFKRFFGDMNILNKRMNRYIFKLKKFETLALHSNVNFENHIKLRNFMVINEIVIENSEREPKLFKFLKKNFKTLNFSHSFKI